MTTSPPIPSPGDVVTLQIDFMDGTGAKARPAVVLSTRQFNQARSYFVYTPLTGSAGSFTDSARSEVRDIGAAGLNGGSFSHGIVATATNRDIRRIIGRLSNQDRTGIRQLLGDIISI